MKRKLFAALLALIMVFSLLPIAFAPKTAVADDYTPINQSIVQGGNILHCFDWSYKEIEANLQAIKDAGYVAVQTSPVQPAKDYNAAWNSTVDNWWKLYQPLGFRIADSSETWLGSRQDLIDLCDAAEAKGIKVIVDVVANHVANVSGGGFTTNGTYNVSSQVDADLQDPDGTKGLYHTSENGVNDGSRYNMTQYHLGMPDLNTQNTVVQNYVLNFLKECVDCGVDGFRFDAAKHIELPHDAGCGDSQFWPTIINGIRTYADGQDGRASDLYMYGESLSGSGEDWVNEFTSMMGLTDSQTGNAARSAVVDQNAGSLANSFYSRGSNQKDYVLWAESHDTYLENNGTRNIEDQYILRTWAIVGARAQSTALFLARPNELMGKASSDTSWKSPVVAAVNKFKARYDGCGEYLSYDQDAKVTWIERGDAYHLPGVVISKLDGAGEVELGAYMMMDGSYKDEITGNVFNVSNGKIKGNVGPTGVAVVYEYLGRPELPHITADKIYFIPDGWWLNDDAVFGMFLFNKADGAITVNKFVPLRDDDIDGIFEASVPETDPEYGYWEYVSFLRMDPDKGNDSLFWDAVWNQVANLVNDPGTNCFTISAPDGEDATGTWSYYGPITADPIYFVPTGWWLDDGARFEMYLFNNNGGSEWVTLTDEDGDGVYQAALPAGNWTGLNFVRMNPSSTEHDASGKWNQTDDLVPDPGTNCFTITAGSSNGTWSLYVPSQEPAEAGYYLVGTMTGWGVLPEYKLADNDNDGIYTIETNLIRTSLPYNSQFKVVKSNDGVSIDQWYPAGMNNNYGDKGEAYKDEIPQSGIYTISFKPNGGVEGWHEGYIKAERTKFFVTVDTTDRNGTVTVDKEIAAPNETVTVTVTPNAGYELDTLVCQCETGFNTGEFNTYDIDKTTLTFNMPAENASVKATFKENLSTANGYSLIGPDWTAGGIDLTKQFAENPYSAGEFMLTTTLAADDEIKVVKVENGAITAWYPDGEGTQYIVDAAHAGDKTIYFKTEYQNDWADFGGYFYIESNPAADAGYYLIGTMNDWTIASAYKLEENPAVLGEFLIDATLQTTDQFKIVYSADGSSKTTYYPGDGKQNYGENGEIRYDGVYHIYFRPGYNGESDWYENCIYAAQDDGYYLVGDMTGWQINSAYKLYQNPGNQTELMIDVPLKTTNQFKIVYSMNGENIMRWFPANGGNYGQDGEIQANGTYHVYFNPDANTDGWFCNCIYAALDQTLPSFETQSMYLDGQIGVNFKMELPQNNDLSYTNCTMTYAIANGTCTEGPIDGNKFTCYINSIQMAEPITATFHYYYVKDGANIEKTLTKVYTVEDYFAAFDQYVSEHPGVFAQEEINLVHAFANYGYYVQHFLEQENPNWSYADGNYTEMQKHYENELPYTDVTAAAVAGYAFTKSIAANANIEKITYALALDSTTSIKVFITPSGTYTGDEMSVSVDNGDAYQISKQSDGRFCVQIKNIKAQDLSHKYTINVNGGKDNGGATIETSALSYVRSMLVETTKSTFTGDPLTWGNAASAIYAYAKAANDYVEWLKQNQNP